MVFNGPLWCCNFVLCKQLPHFCFPFSHQHLFCFDGIVYHRLHVVMLWSNTLPTGLHTIYRLMHYLIAVARVTRPECQRHKGRSHRPTVPLARIKLEVNFYVLNTNFVVHNFPWHLCEQVDPITSGGIPSSLIILLQFGAVAYGEPMAIQGWHNHGGESQPKKLAHNTCKMTSLVYSNEDDIRCY